MARVDYEARACKLAALLIFVCVAIPLVMVGMWAVQTGAPGIGGVVALLVLAFAAAAAVPFSEWAATPPSHRSPADFISSKRN